MPLIFWAAAVLLKFTVPVPGVNVPPSLVQSPVTLMAEAVPTAKVPRVRVMLLTFKVAVLPPMLKV